MSSNVEKGNPSSPSASDRLKVFISYSRADSPFADELAAGLEFDGGFEVLIDRLSIHEGEDWKARLGYLIAEADTVVFVLSPQSATSPICCWEVGEAKRQSKRIVPVQAASLSGVKPPQELAALNYVRFDPEDSGRPRSFMAGLVGLRRALKTDLVWLREHTRLLSRAQEWEAAGRAESRLLLGNDIVDAKSWLDRHPREAPPPTGLHRDFIAASDQAEVARQDHERNRAEQLQGAIQKMRIALGGALALSVGLAIAGYYAYLESARATELAKQLVTLQKIQAGTEQAPQLPASIQSSVKPEFLTSVRFALTKDAARVRLLEELRFRDSSGTIWTVPANYISDGASIPRSLWSFMGSPFQGNLVNASVLHDYHTALKQRTPEQVNAMFYDALRASGVDETRSKLLFAAVTRFGPRWQIKR